MCVMSPWLFNFYMNEVMKGLMVGVAGECVRMEVPYLLYTDFVFM